MLEKPAIAFDALDDGVLEVIATLLGQVALASSLGRTNRRCFSVATCHPCAFRGPLSAWHATIVVELDKQMSELGMPPEEDLSLDVWAGLAYAERELWLAKLWSEVLREMTGFTNRACGLLEWLIPSDLRAGMQASSGIGMQASSGIRRQCFLDQEVAECKRRLALLLDTARALEERVPDQELPLRWAQWVESVGRAAGLPDSHPILAKYRQQRAGVRATLVTHREQLSSIISVINRQDKRFSRFMQPGKDHDTGNGMCNAVPVSPNLNPNSESVDTEFPSARNWTTTRSCVTTPTPSATSTTLTATAFGAVWC